MSSEPRKYDLSTIPLNESKLDEFAHAMKTVENDTLSETEIRKFFYEKSFSRINCGVVSYYQHNKLQWVMLDYLKGKKYKIVKELNYGHLHTMPPKKHEIKISKNESFQGYEEVTMYLEKTGCKKT